jgi:L-ascorbate metabolism protein UlaG (beta-lactamase superfamily)
MIPTGGEYTLDLAEVDRQIAQLKPRVVIPMHYATEVVDFVPYSANHFLEGKSNVVRVDGNTWSFDPRTLPAELTYMVLEYLR